MTAEARAPTPLEVWAGVECTVNRIGDAQSDQLERSGHAVRLDDLDAIARLGVRTLRYPVLWERTAPDGLASARWEWSDVRLARLRTLGVEPIVGLVHHGSGPRSTSLVDERFPEALAIYARAVAERYPWVRRFTPINEPLTTARFSTLYGHWHPHARDDRLFARACVNQLRGIALAMRAIRAITPDATLIQTEDLGKTYATPRLRHQAEFENERRWLTFDVLTGRFERGMPMWDFLRAAGIPDSELARLADDGCTADILGVNHYLTSERFLDDRVERYPSETHGGNGRERYADVEAVRACVGHGRVRGLLAEVWERYQKPMAVTEAHLGATREHQLRWLDEVWTAASDLRDAGADVRAVTVWSLFGAFDWHNLMTRVEDRYEPGAFDVRAPSPRPTAIAAMIRGLATVGRYDHPVSSGAGWWEAEQRLGYPVVRVGSARDVQRSHPIAPPILIVGAAGTLGSAFVRICEERGLEARACTRDEMDVGDAADVARCLDATQPWAIVNAAGYVRVDDAELAIGECRRTNVVGAEVLAQACSSRAIALVSFSSDLVFDGARPRRRPYVESSATHPLNVYGRSKVDAERRVRELAPTALLVRTSAFFGPWDEHNFVTTVLRSLEDGLPVMAASDEVVAPTYVPDLVHAVLDLLIDGESGIWHLANVGALSWAELARCVARIGGFDPSLVQSCAGASFGRAARRPPYSVLGSERGMLLSSVDDGLQRYFSARANRTRFVVTGAV